MEEFGAPDIVFDDGFHYVPQVNKTFGVLYPMLGLSGSYLVEDLNAAYTPEQGGGYKKPDSFIEGCKDLIDEINKRHPSGCMITVE